MSLFGDVDVNEIDDLPDNPFFVDAGVYPVVVTGAEIRDAKEDGDVPVLVITYSIEQPSSAYHGSNLQDWFPLVLLKPEFKDLKFKERMDLLDTNEKRTVKNMKARLSVGFDMSPAEIVALDPDTVADTLIGKELVVTVKVSTAKDDETKKYSNIAKAISKKQATDNDAVVRESLRI